MFKVQIFGHQYGVSDSCTTLLLCGGGSSGFPDINDARHRGNPLLYWGGSWLNPSTFHILLSNQMHPCKNCQDGFSAITPKGLKLHQKICQSFLKQEAAANQRRKSTAAKNAIIRTKLKEHKMRLGSAALGVQVRFL